MVIKVSGFPGLPSFLDRIKVKRTAIAFGITEDEAALRLQQTPHLVVPELEDNAPKIPLLPKPKYEAQDTAFHNFEGEFFGKNQPREKEGLQSHRDTLPAEPKAANSS